MVSSLSVDVLIVDDSVVDLRLLMHMMETQDLTFAVAQDPFSGFDKAKELLPGLILLDVRMSGMDGYQLCRLLKSDPTTRHIPVIFLTAASDLQERLYGFCAGGVDYISKPFSPEEVLAQVQAQAIQADIQKKAAELDLERQKMIMSDERERDRIEQDGILRRYELELKYGVQIQSAEINAAMNTDRELIRQQAAMNQTQVPQQPQPMM